MKTLIITGIMAKIRYTGYDITEEELMQLVVKKLNELTEAPNTEFFLERGANIVHKEPT